MKNLFCAATVIASCVTAPASAALSPITPAQSLSNVGQCVAVEGIASVRKDPQRLGTDIDLDGEHSAFLGYIPPGNERQFSNLAKLKGQKVRIVGVVQMYLGRGEVRITNPSQLRAARGPSPNDTANHLPPEFGHNGSAMAPCDP